MVCFLKYLTKTAIFSKICFVNAHRQDVPATKGNAMRFAQIAQSVEQRTENPRVTGSIPVLGMEKPLWILHEWY